MGSSPSEPYERLAELLESELRLVAHRRFDELPRLNAARTALVTKFPTIPPPGARSALERCAALNAQVRDELLRARSGALAALADIRRGQHALRAYAPLRRRPARISANA